MTHSDSAEIADRLIKGLDVLGERFGEVQVVLTYTPEGTFGDRWVCGITMGREAPDSPMAGGLACGLGDTAEEALNVALGEAGGLS